jgi:hypothetical protein
MSIERKSVNKEYVEQSQVLFTEEDLREAVGCICSDLH